MNLRDLAARAKEMVDRRGGTGALREDADELKRIAQGEGTMTDKAKAAADALKDPGGREAASEQAATSSDAPPAASASPAERERAAGKVKGEGRGKHGATGGGRRGQGKRRGGAGRGQGRGRDQL
ncbi:MAG TPA: hypothetical protein VHF58_04550 [Solirubrobacterales bacterium]|nr:hypothetical protein [Solirubrobacterales bacterium]